MLDTILCVDDHDDGGGNAAADDGDNAAADVGCKILILCKTLMCSICNIMQKNNT